MAEGCVSVACYWGGSTFYGPEGYSYDKVCQRLIWLKHDTTYNQLLDTLYPLMKLDRNQSNIKLTCRVPAVIRGDTVKYIPVEVVDNDTLNGILHTVSQNVGCNLIELYVEVERINVDGVAGQAATCAYTALLSQESVQPHLHNSSDFNEDQICQTQFTSGAGCSGQGQTYEPEYVTTGDANGGQHRDLIQHLVNEYDETIMNIDAFGGEVPRDEEQLEEQMLGQLDDLETPVEVGAVAVDASIDEDIPQLYTQYGGSNVVDESSSPRGSQSGDFYVGLTFIDKDALQTAVKLFSLNNHQNYIVVESTKSKCSVKCKMHETGCKWRLRAYKKKSHQMFEITVYEGPHTCVFLALTQDHSNMDAKFIAIHVKGLVRVDPSIKIVVIVQRIREDFNYTITYKKAWHAKQKALALAFGDWDESYAELPKFLNALSHYNEGSKVIVKGILQPVVDPDTDLVEHFQRLFWTLKASIDGFAHCRPVVSVDGTHLYGKYKGKMLIAMGSDANNQIFPLAFAVVNEENTDNWEWFLRLLKIYVLRDREHICLISDRHAGILAAVERQSSWWTEPKGYHRYCLRHVRSNFCEKFKGKNLKKLVWIAGTTPQVRKFHKVMENIKKRDEDAWQYLTEIDKTKWTLAFDGGCRYGIVTTNMSEVY